MEAKYIQEKDLPQAEMTLFNQNYPCYLEFRLPYITNKGELAVFYYETIEIEGKWLLKTI